MPPVKTSENTQQEAALVQWLQSQDIPPTLAVCLLANTMCDVIRHLCRGLDNPHQTAIDACDAICKDMIIDIRKHQP